MQRQYLEALFTNTPNAIIAIDQHFHVLDCNPAAANTFGWFDTTPEKGTNFYFTVPLYVSSLAL